MKNVLAVDIGGSKLLVGIVNEAGEVLYQKKYPLSHSTDKSILKNIALAKSELPDIGYAAAGVNIPGLCNPDLGLWVDAPFSGIKNFEIKNALNPILQVPVYIENDVNSCAVAERKFGCCKNIDDFLWVTVSNGIGGAVFTGGKIYSGSRFSAGEIGHFIVEEQGGFKCGCGRYGCLEAQASGAAIPKHYFKIKQIPFDKSLSAKEIADFANAGDDAAVKSFDIAGRYIGKALAAAANLLNPKKIILGGGVMMSSSLILPAINEAFEKAVFKSANRDIKIEKTSLGYNAALLGAAGIAM
jgi:glucokinase